MKWWYLPVAVVIGAIFAMALRRNPITQIMKELKAFDDAAQVKKDVVMMGADKARALVEADHAEAIERFDQTQKARVEALRSDPVALAKWLARVSA